MQSRYRWPFSMGWLLGFVAVAAMAWWAMQLLWAPDVMQEYGRAALRISLTAAAALAWVLAARVRHQTPFLALLLLGIALAFSVLLVPSIH